MSKKLITIILVVVVSVIIASSSVNAFRSRPDLVDNAGNNDSYDPEFGDVDTGFFGKWFKLAGTLKNVWDLARGGGNGISGPTFVFGGHITHSEGGCDITFRAWFWIYSAYYTGPAAYPPHFGCFGLCPKPRLPLGGNTIEVGPPVNSPTGQMFTFPFISQIYANHSEGREGPWALGTGFTSSTLIDKINDTLGDVSINLLSPGSGCPGPVAGEPYVPYCFDTFKLECSENNKNFILKMGTSK